MYSPKYKVMEGSESGHCCFEVTVIDTTKSRHEDTMCECFTLESAHSICAALNDIESTRSI